MDKAELAHMESGSDSANQYLIFSLGREEYGVDIQKVQELRGYETPTHLVNAPTHMKGVVNLRGVIVPIVDMRTKFDLGGPTYDQTTVVIIVNLPRHVVGMVVDGVSDVITLAPDQIKPAPEMAAAFGADNLIGLGALDDRMLILLDIERVLSAGELAA